MDTDQQKLSQKLEKDMKKLNDKIKKSEEDCKAYAEKVAHKASKQSEPLFDSKPTKGGKVDAGAVNRIAKLLKDTIRHQAEYETSSDKRILILHKMVRVLQHSTFKKLRGFQGSALQMGEMQTNSPSHSVFELKKQESLSKGI